MKILIIKHQDLLQADKDTFFFTCVIFFYLSQLRDKNALLPK